MFWSRLDGLNDKKTILKFILRNAKLYLFWFIVFLPYILVKGGYLQGNLFINFVKLLVRLLLGSTFPASWYIVALTIGVLIVYFLNKHLNHYIVLIFCLLIYLLCCLCSNYYLLFNSGNNIIQMIYIYFPGTIYNSFPVGLFWISLGGTLARKTNQRSPRLNLIMSIISLVFLLIEYYVIQRINCSQDNDCYIMLVPLCYFVVETLVNVKINLKNSKELCNASTIVYCSHGVIATLLISTQHFKTAFEQVFLFVVTVILSLILAFIIIRLERYKFFRFLRFSH